MRHSSRIIRILCLLALLPTPVLAARAPGPGIGIGSARGLSPIRPVVGSARGASPARPIVGAARGLSPIRPQATGYGTQARWPSIRDRRRESNRYGSFGYGSSGYGGFGYGDAAFGYGTVGLDGTFDAQQGPAGGDEMRVPPLPVLLSPPPPCVRPQIIRIGRSSSRGPGAAGRSSGQRPKVRIVYGAPPCGV